MKRMKRVRRYFAFAVATYIVLAVMVFSGTLGSAIAGSSEPLILENASGETLTVGSVSVDNDGANLVIEFVTYDDYPLNFTALTFRGNTGGILHATSDVAGYITHKSSNRHTYTIPLSLIKNESVQIAASADVIVNDEITNTRKAFITVFFTLPSTTVTTCQPTTTTTCQPTTTTTAPTTTTESTSTTTTQPPGSTTSTTSGGGTTTTVGATTTTTSGGGNGGTTSTTRSFGGNGATTTVRATTTTTQAPVTTTTTVQGRVVTTVPTQVEREELPFTGSDYNWYLIGFMLAITGTGLFVWSLKRE